MKASGGILIFLWIASLMIALGAGVYYYGHTLVVWWRPVVPGVVIGIAATAVLRRFKRMRTTWNTIACAILACAIGWAAILCGNYELADTSTEHIEQVTVEKKYRKEHDETRRSGRRTIRTGRKISTYYAEAKFPDGRTKEISISFSEYRRIRTGNELDFKCRTGYLSYPVFDRK